MRPPHRDSEASFTELWEKFRLGEEDAAKELVNRYGRQLQAVFTVRLHSSPLRVLYDPEDVVQSVFRRLHQTNRTPEILDSQCLLRWFVKVGYNRIGELERRLVREKKCARQAASSKQAKDGPDTVEERMELANLVKRQLDEEEWELFRLKRIEDRSWKEIASISARTADAVRMKLERALQRVRETLEAQ